jgi:TrmH family RNA methyltransferase
LILVEGKRLLDQIHRNEVAIKELFCKEDEAKQFEYLAPGKFTFCEAWQLEKLAQTKSPQKVVGLIEAEKQAIKKTEFLLYLDNISEPGNLGTIYRTAAGLGVDGIITSPDCCEVFNPRSVRASMGAVLSVPTMECDHNWLMSQEAAIIVTALDNAVSINEISETQKPAILVIGSEAHGVNEQILNRADLKVKIPMTGKMESLNAAVAAGIVIYKLLGDGHLKR